MAGRTQIVAAGLKPEAIIGDFDSLKNPMRWLGRTRLIAHRRAGHHGL